MDDGGGQKKKKQSILELELETRTLILDRMPKFFAIIALLCCAVEICLAGDALQAWVNAGNTSVIKIYGERLKDQI